MELIRSRDNARIKQLHGLAHSARDRRKHAQTLLDGAHLIDAALTAGWPLQMLIVAESSAAGAEIAGLLDRVPAEVVRLMLPDPLFAHVSPVDTPSGVLARIAWPASEAQDMPACTDSVIVLDRVQDPGNLGTILRTAAAAGVRDAWLSAGCAQAWSPRVLRAGMGAHFVLRIHEQVDVLAELARFPGARLATALGDGARSLYDFDLRGPVAWMFGAEGQGLSAALLAAADGRVIIPMPGAVESLNVGAAAAICLFEQVRQRHR